jgi:hypothetical protein
VGCDAQRRELIKRARAVGLASREYNRTSTSHHRHISAYGGRFAADIPALA